MMINIYLIDNYFTRFAGVKLIPGEITALQLDIEVWGKGGYNKRSVRIPVPRGCNNEAEKVISELTT